MVLAGLRRSIYGLFLSFDDLFHLQLRYNSYLHDGGSWILGSEAVTVAALTLSDACCGYTV